MDWLRLASRGIAWLSLAWFRLAWLELASLGSNDGNWMVYCGKLDGLLIERMQSIKGNSPADFLHI